MKTKIIIGADHAGFTTKEYVKKQLEKKGYTVDDVGAHQIVADDDYPDYAKKVARKVLQQKTQGILICGSGAGVAIAANKVNGIRAAEVFDEYGAIFARKDDHANIITLRGRKFPKTKAAKLALAFIKAEKDMHPRHLRRIRKITRMEQ